MRPSYAVRQALTAALAANAIKPPRGRHVTMPAFAAGWLTSELAPQLLVASALDMTLEVSRRRTASWPTVALGAATMGALGYVIWGARGSGARVEGMLSESLGRDYLDQPPLEDAKVALREIARPFKLHDPDVQVERDINYAVGGKRARLDIYRSSRTPTSGAPVLIQIHGGGWTIGTKEQQGRLLMNRMAKAGWVCVAPNYRLAPKHPWPAQIVDVKKAIAWVRENIASYGGDPAYLVITGGSAGGHLAALAALTPGLAEFQPDFEDADTSVAACVPFYGVYDMAGLTGTKEAVGMRDYFLAPRVFAKNPERDLETFVQASPLAQLTDHTPDFFVIHGSNDSLVEVSQARAFVEALKAQTDASVTYAELPGTQHAFEVFSSWRSQQVIRAVARWLTWHRSTHQHS